jgi:hypothetical protein
MPDKVLLRELLKLLQFSFKAVGHLLVYAGIRGEDTEHNRLFGALLEGPAEDAGIALVEDLSNQIVVDAFYSVPDGATAIGTGRNLLGHGLTTCLTEFHKPLSDEDLQKR